MTRSGSTRVPAAERHPLRILLIENDTVDATWLEGLIKERCSTSEVMRSASLPDAFAALAQQQIDTVFVSIRPEGEIPSLRECHEIVRRAGPRPVVALLNATETALVPEILATGVKFVYRKHPIWRTAQIRKQELRDKFRSGGDHGQTLVRR
jgi:DNA-binding NarL/FixJ family response regulator